MRCAVLCLFALILGCSSIYTDGGVPEGFLCREDSANACPEGQICDVAKGCCRRPGSSCVGVSDLQPPASDLQYVDLSEPFGCVGRGRRISTGLYGCDGPFNRNAAALCAPGYALADSNLSRTELDDCNAQKDGFYLSKSLIYHSGLNVMNPVQCNILFADTIACTAPNPLTFRFRLGCGGFRFNGYLECYKKCGGLYQVASCYPPTPIDCFNSQIPGTLEDVTTNSSIGVLCRRN